MVYCWEKFGTPPQRLNTSFISELPGRLSISETISSVNSIEPTNIILLPETLELKNFPSLPPKDISEPLNGQSSAFVSFVIVFVSVSEVSSPLFDFDPPIK